MSVATIISEYPTPYDGPPRTEFPVEPPKYYVYMTQLVA